VGLGGECVTPVLLDHLSAASNWIGVQTGVHGFNSFTPHKPVVSKTSEADIWLSSYDHLTHVGGLRGGCQQLPQRKDACFKLKKKEALSGLIQVNDDEERNGGQAGRVWLPAIGTWGLSNPGLQMLGSNEWYVSYQYGTRASFQYIRRIPALYILRPKKNLKQLESCQLSSQYE